MIFGKIDYINLLPFSIFIKSLPFATNIRNATKKGVPSKINFMFNRRKVDAAFISSIKSKNKTSLDMGIVVKKDVMSVIIYLGDNEEDIESNTSNILAKVLNLDGKVLIGDKALINNFYNPNCIDLAEVWTNKYKLPFVFARFCYNSDSKYFTKLLSLYKQPKISHYILLQTSKKVGLPVWYLKLYLSKIDYKIDLKAKKGLKLFLSKSRRVKFE